MSEPVMNLSLRPIRMAAFRPVILVGTGAPLRSDGIDAIKGAEALRLFRAGLDTFDIAWRLECSEAAAANGIALAREEERRAAA